VAEDEPPDTRRTLNHVALTTLAAPFSMERRVGAHGHGLGKGPLGERFVEPAEASRRASVNGRQVMGQALAGAKEEWAARTHGGHGDGSGAMTTVAVGPSMDARSLGRPVPPRFVEAGRAAELLRLQGRGSMASTLAAAKGEWEARVGAGGDTTPRPTLANQAPAMLGALAGRQALALEAGGGASSALAVVGGGGGAGGRLGADLGGKAAAARFASEGRASMGAAGASAKSAWEARAAAGGSMATEATAPACLQRSHLSPEKGDRFVEFGAAQEVMERKGRSSMASTLAAAKSEWEARQGPRAALPEGTSI